MTVEQSSSENEMPAAGIMGEVFLEPEPAEIKVKTIDQAVAIQLRTSECRLLTLKLLLEPHEARELVEAVETRL